MPFSVAASVAATVVAAKAASKEQGLVNLYKSAYSQNLQNSNVLAFNRANTTNHPYLEYNPEQPAPVRIDENTYMVPHTFALPDPTLPSYIAPHLTIPEKPTRDLGAIRRIIEGVVIAVATSGVLMYVAKHI